MVGSSQSCFHPDPGGEEVEHVAASLASERQETPEQRQQALPDDVVRSKGKLMALTKELREELKTDIKATLETFKDKINSCLTTRQEDIDLVGTRTMDLENKLQDME
ncbi:hypothetical protein NDU88_006945 [Pleurodeles waltl]|uniref:Uncharacterized protein n=1 Tax=Pleurodeles waltl TaxID=8319 RepID=A0AAV7NWL3_PLEWA|nr:hypothetical protein NDU88_006945 [Pleurodeles waltl]